MSIFNLHLIGLYILEWFEFDISAFFEVAVRMVADIVGLVLQIVESPEE